MALAKPDYRHQRSTSDFIPRDAGEYTEELADVIERMTTGYWPTIGVEKGWYKLITDLNAELRLIAHEYRITHIGNRFGELAYYITVKKTDEDKRPEMMRIIKKYNEISKTTCQICGNSGIRSNLRVACETHAGKTARKGAK